MNTHETAEALSAYLDGEVDQAARSAIEAHLESCPSCRGRLQALGAASASLRSLEEVAPTAEESRELRRTLTQPAPRRWASRGLTAVVGAGALTAAALALVFFVFNPPARQGGQDTTLEQQESSGVPSGFEFASEEDVRDTVPGLAEVTSGWRRYTVADVGRSQDEQIERLTGEDPVARGEGQLGSERADTPEAGGALSSDVAGAATIRECLDGVLRTQPYPMMPLMAEDAWFKETPAWMLVFAYRADSDEDDDPLDRIQVQILRRTDCNQLHYWTFRPR
jgi:hypothetical protein